MPGFTVTFEKISRDFCKYLALLLFRTSVEAILVTPYSMNNLFSEFSTKFGGASLEELRLFTVTLGRYFGAALEGLRGINYDYSDLLSN